MRGQPFTLILRFFSSARATASIEFAILAPLLIAIQLGFYDGMTAVSIYAKTRYATATLGAIVNQYTTIHDADMQQILGATTAVLAPYASTSATTNVTQIAVSASGNATVSWSTNLTAGSTFNLPTGLAVPNSYLIYCTVSYPFTPTFSFFRSTGITLSDSLYVSPRNSASVSRISP